MKILAMYLPQFHRIPENDEWWGEGFTEWTSVKNAKPLFKAHMQPREPFNDNYYDLMKKETMIWQANLMKEYGVDGAVFYHYSFKDGRRILEKPAENLLAWNDIDMPFCFSWANETWARSWSYISSKNIWAPESEETDPSDDNNGILLEQSYGDKEDWIDHYNYLRSFFYDSRYIKKDGKPVFIIYKPQEVSCLSNMLKTWREEAHKDGFPDLYIISTNSYSECCDAELFQEPQYTLMLCYGDKYAGNQKEAERVIDYDEICQSSLKIQKKMRNEKQIGCVFPSYDDTPRRGRAGTIISDASPKKFYNYLRHSLSLSLGRKSDFLFINAWNEWGETMYLEPDKCYQYGFLESVKEARSMPYLSLGDEKEEEDPEDIVTDSIEKKLNQYRSYWITMDKWLTLKEENKSISDYLNSINVRKIAVYGLGMLGMHFVKEMEFNRLRIEYGIDGKGDRIKMSFPVYTLSDELPEVDAVVVTVVHEYDRILKGLKKRINADIFSLYDLIERTLG